MARGRNRSRRRNSGMRIPLSVVAGFIPLLKNTYDHYRWFGYNDPTNPQLDAPNFFIFALSGFNNVKKSFEPAGMKYGLIPIGVGLAVHQLANKLGLNRVLGRMGIPIIRI